MMRDGSMRRGHDSNSTRTVLHCVNCHSKMRLVLVIISVKLVAEPCRRSCSKAYFLAFRRVGILDGQEQLEINPVVQEVLSSEGLWSEKVRAEILEKGSVSGLTNVPKRLEQLLATAHEVPWEYHLAHQQAFQEHTDNAVSKTVNLPRETPIDIVASVYQTAWEMGLKGITIYRDGSRQDQVLQHCSSAVACYL